MVRSISCIIPTFRCPVGLERAINSILDQSGRNNISEIIIADNDPDGSAKKLVYRIAKSSEIKIIYTHIPEAGVANAMNGALNIAQSRIIMWLDDDQELGPNWISSMIAANKKFKAALVFCPTKAIVEGNFANQTFFEQFFERKGPDKPDGIINEFFGCGNSLMDMRKFPLPSPIFDPCTNETGGEDDVLFTHVQNSGGTIAWINTCFATEYIRPHRVSKNIFF